MNPEDVSMLAIYVFSCRNSGIAGALIGALLGDMTIGLVAGIGGAAAHTLFCWLLAEDYL